MFEAEFFKLVIPIALLIGAYFIGTRAEKQHYRDLLFREQASSEFVVTTFPYEPKDTPIIESKLVTGSVVISVDYFKRFLSGLRMLFGGRLSSYTPLLDRARREAMLRLKEDAKTQGFDAVTNVRLETSRLANGTARNNEGTAAVEILAFGTALKFIKSTNNL